MAKGIEPSASQGRPLEFGRFPGVRAHLKRVVRLSALWGNLVYVGSCLVAVGVLAGLGPAPWRAYANVFVMFAVAAGTALLNLKAARGGLTVAASGVAVVLNLACLAYFAVKPAYSVSGLRLLVVLVQLMNVAVIVSGWGRRVVAARRA